MPVPVSETIRCLRGQWPNQVGGHTHVGLPRVGPPPPVPLGKTGVHTPQTEVGNRPQTEVGNRPPPVKAVNQLPQGLLLDCPPGQREVVMASHGIRGQCRN